jgi:hypothetical protein
MTFGRDYHTAVVNAKELVTELHDAADEAEAARKAMRTTRKSFWEMGG